MIAERVKYLHQNQIEASSFFWRTTQQQEIDYIEKHGENLLAVEFKWNEKKKVRIPTTFTHAYQEVTQLFVSKADRSTFLK